MRHAGAVRAVRSTARTRQRLTLLGAVALPLALVAAVSAWLSSGPAPVVAAPAAAQGAPEAGEVLRLRSGGRDRAVLVQEPLGEQRARALALVLGPHGLTAAQTARSMRMDALRLRGYAVAYPSALDGDWNAGRCCGSSAALAVDDVGFLRDVRVLLGQRYPQVRDRVALIGYSTGGQMTYRAVCAVPTLVRAAVVVAGSLETDCRPRSRMPATLIVHGLDDATVPWAFTTRRIRLLDFAPRPALSSLAAYARAGDCQDQRLDRSDGRWLLGWDGCTRVGTLSAVGMPDAGHAWERLAGSVYTARFLSREVG
jgi:poly(3-hydroxybutyrate) depolymerase